MDCLSPRPGLSTEWVSGQTGPHKETCVSRNQIEIYASWPPFFTNLCNMFVHITYMLLFSVCDGSVTYVLRADCWALDR